MRAYIPSYEEDFRYPEDMEIILDYLKAHGQLNIKPKMVERYYEDFSEEKYAAGWLGINDPYEDKHLLRQFSIYLSEIDI